MITALALVGLAHVGVATLLPRLGPSGRTRLVALPPVLLLVVLGTWVVDGARDVTASAPWVPTLGLELAVRVDALAVLLLALVGAIGVAVLVHAARSVAPDQQVRVLVQLLLFATAMSVLVIADDLVLLALGWEATSVLSFLLVGTKDGSHEARAAARRALAVTGGGGLALLGGIVLIGVDTGITTLSGLAAAPPTQAMGVTGVVLLALGIATKSAQWPFHGWLPGAMAAPAPVSAYLHSATMVKAGVYLALRLAPVLAVTTAPRVLLTVLASVTVLWGGWQALRSDDLKRLLAFSTTAQLGLMVLVIAQGTAKAVLAGVALLVAHAAAKAALFLSVGTLEAAHATRDVDGLAGAARADRVAGWAVTVAFASLAGVPILGGFVAKEAGLVALDDAGTGLATAALVVFVVGAAMTAAYALRVVRSLWRPTLPATTVEVAPVMRFAPLALAAVTAGLGVAWPVFDRFGVAAAVAVDRGADAHHLTVWAGPTLAVALSGAALTGGVVLAAWRHDRTDPVPDPGPHLYDRIIDLPAAAGRRVVAATRPGDLRATTAWIVLLAVALAVPPLLRSGGGLQVGPAMASLALLGVVAGASAVTLVQHRFGAVLGLGVVGFAMAGWFATRGAPDLALTQVLVEMVIVLAFLLLLKRLSHRAPAPGWGRGTRLRLVVALAAAGIGVGVALAAASVVAPTPVTDLAVAQALPDAEGRNVVNVILTDFRALDTMAEIGVLAIAALGMHRLFRLARTADA